MNEVKEQSCFSLKHILIIATIGIAPFLGNLDGSIVMIACPLLERIFHTNTAGISMVMVSYLLINAGFALIFGRLGDMKGPGRVFTAGFIVITIGSILCGFAGGLHQLVAFRVVQALGSTMLFSTYCAVVVTSLPESMRGRAFGFIGVLGSIGFAVGAPLGGFILKFLDWRWLFLFNIPFGIAGLILCSKYIVNRGATVSKTAPFDFQGGILSLIFLISLVYALHVGQKTGWTGGFIMGLIGVSIISLILFIKRERKFTAPLIDVTIFNNARLNFAVISALLVIVLLNGVLFLFPYFLELVKGLSAEKAGLVMMSLPVAVFIFSPLAGLLTDRKSPRLIASVSTVFILVSCVLFTFIGRDTLLWFILPSFVLFGVSLAFFTVSNMTLVMSHAGEGKQGIISAVLAVINSVGALMGVTFFQMIFSHFIGRDVQGLHSISPDKISGGFHGAMVLAVVLCIIALLVTFPAGRKN